VNLFSLFSAHYEKQMETWCLKPFICKRLMRVGFLLGPHWEQSG